MILEWTCPKSGKVFDILNQQQELAEHKVWLEKSYTKQEKDKLRREFIRKQKELTIPLLQKADTEKAFVAILEKYIDTCYPKTTYGRIRIETSDCFHSFERVTFYVKNAPDLTSLFGGSSGDKFYRIGRKTSAFRPVI